MMHTECKCRGPTMGFDNEQRIIIGDSYPSWQSSRHKLTNNIGGFTGIRIR